MQERDIFLKKFGWFGIIRLFVYPLTTFLTTPVQLFKSVWNCRVITEGKEWSAYSGFDLRRALTYLFYYNRALNLYKYGRSGYSPNISLGNSDLSRLFFYTLFSLYAFWGGGVVVILSGMFGWLFTHLIWIQSHNLIWISSILFLAMVSTTFYSNLFYFQNYNTLGWLIFPILLFGLINGNYFIFGIACFLTSFTSLTVLFLASILALVISIVSLSWLPLIALVPATIKILAHFYQSFKRGKTSSVLFNVARAVGISGKKIKYRRDQTKKLGTHRLYLILLYIQYLFCYYLFTEKISILLVSGIVLYFINTILVRFADFQSLQMLLFSLCTALTIQTPYPLLLVSYWIAISPIPLVAFIFRYPMQLDVVPVFAPCFLKPIMTEMEDFFKKIPEGKRILLALNDPQNIYENIFDGYRDIIELPLYIASRQNLHLFPDYQAIAEVNYYDAPDFWGRDVNSVLKNTKEWSADYVMIYQNSGSELDSIWEENGFKLISHFSWQNYADQFIHGKPFDGDTPDWWLLSVP